MKEQKMTMEAFLRTMEDYQTVQATSHVRRTAAKVLFRNWKSSCRLFSGNSALTSIPNHIRNLLYFVYFLIRLGNG